MGDPLVATGIARDPSDRIRVNRLMWFFALVYVAEGAGQTDGLIAQPLNYYLKQVYQWSPVEITAYLTVLNLPWFIKPVYGAVSDFVPFLGYRRKSYLLLACAGAAVAYVLVARTSDPALLIVFLLLTAYGMAIASTLCGALLVENGHKFGASAPFVNQQWLWFNIAAMASAVTGGALIESLSPATALHMAALIVGIAPLAVVFGTTKLVEEEKTTLSPEGLRETFGGLIAAFRQRGIWVIAGFLFFYYFSPGFATPFYFHMTDTLKFSQAYIGVLTAIGSAGWIAGALVYRTLLRDLAPKTLLKLSILFGVLATSSYLLLFDPLTAAFANFCYGASLMIMFVATLSLAADHCPPRAEGFAFATLMSVTNVAGSLADNAGSLLYEHLFGGRLYPLVLVSAGFTALTFLLIPMLRLEAKASSADTLVSGAEWIDDARPSPIAPRR